MTNNIICLVAVIELLIGTSTFITTFLLKIFSISAKPLNVFIFVLISSTISIIIGLGLLRRKNWARSVVIFFSGYVLLTKFLIYFGVLEFSGEVFTLIPIEFKDFVSFIYHLFVIYFFSRRRIRDIFVIPKMKLE